MNIAQPFRRVKSERQSKFPPGHFVVADFVSLASPGPGKARSLHRSSSPTQTRYAGLCVGGRLRRPVGRKISNGAVQKLRLALTSQRYRPVPAVGAAFGRPRAGLGPAPTERPESFPYFVGAAHGAARERPDGGIGPYKRSNAPSDTPYGRVSSPARRSPEPNLSPTHAKGALSTDRRNTQRLPDPQRQR